MVVPSCGRMTNLGLPGRFLKSETSKGELYELHPDGNSFDFFNGLIRHKLNVDKYA